MIRSYIIIAFRSLVRNKTSSFINIFGLALGMSVAIIIGLWVTDELSFDRSFLHHKQLAEIMLNQTDQDGTSTGPVIAPPIAEPLRTQYGSDFEGTSLVSYNYEHVLAAGGKILSQHGRWVQIPFPAMFSLRIIYGTVDALKDPNTIMINRSLAVALFDQVDALNKTLRIDNRFEMKVGAVYEDLSDNTSLGITDYLLSWDNHENYLSTITDWDNHSCEMYVQLHAGADLAQLNERVKKIPSSHIPKIKEEIMLYPLDKVHLYDQFENGKPSGGRINFIWMVSTIGGFVLLLACINFMNLSTARSEKRAKEVGIRKTIGSMRRQLIGQFLVESILIAFLAMLLALVASSLSMPFFNLLAGKTMSINWTSPLFWSLLVAFVLLSGLIAGSYPAFYLSAFKPAKVLKGSMKGGHLAALPRKILVVMQFTVSVTLIIGTIIIYQQIQFTKDRPVGYSLNGLITIPIKTPDLQGHYDIIRNALLETGVVENMAESSLATTNFDNNNSVEWAGSDKSLDINFRDVFVTPDFGKTINWKVTDGRDFDRDILSDSNAVLINQTAASITKFKNPIGERITYFKKSYKIIGVVEDMVSRTPYDKIEPAIFLMGKNLYVITIRIKSTVSAQKALAQIEVVFKNLNPNAPFEYAFTDDEFGKKFQEEERTANLAGVFAILTIIISCLGIFGLASYMAEQRAKEIGIRKILGATVANLWLMLSSDFVFLVLISCLVAIPFSFYSLERWLQQYAYRTELSWSVFLLSGLGAIIITLATVSYQSVKAAVINPVNSLRNE